MVNVTFKINFLMSTLTICCVCVFPLLFCFSLYPKLLRHVKQQNFKMAAITNCNDLQRGKRDRRMRSIIARGGPIGVQCQASLSPSGGAGHPFPVHTSAAPTHPCTPPSYTPTHSNPASWMVPVYIVLAKCRFCYVLSLHNIALYTAS